MKIFKNNIPTCKRKKITFTLDVPVSSSDNSVSLSTRIYPLSVTSPNSPYNSGTQ